MKGFLAVFERELAERRLLLWVGIVGLVPLALPFLPGVAPSLVQDLRDLTALVVALVVSGALALLLGGTVIGSDLSQNRLGFYFSRPLSGWAIWAGKVSAALVLSLATALLVTLPALAVDGELPWGWLTGGLPQPRPAFPAPFFAAAWFVAIWAALVLAIVLAAHAAGVMLRSRSPLLALDLAALGAATGLIWAAVERLRLAGAIGALVLACVVLALLAAAAVTIAGAAQVVVGRTDARRGHRTLSATLWGTLLAGALAAVLYAGWVVAATPSDLTTFYAIGPAPAGRWAVVAGPAAHRAGYVPSFLVDLASPRFLRLPPLASLRFSADGRRAAWLASDERADDAPVAVVTADLAASRTVPVRSRVAFPRRVRGLVLSPDGARIAALDTTRLIVADLVSGRLLAAALLGSLPAPPTSLVFSDPSHVRVYERELVAPGAMRTQIVELDLATGKLRTTGSFAGPSYPPFELSPDLRLLKLAGERGDHPIERVLDARTGQPLLDLPGSPSPSPSSFFFLLGGRFAELVHADRVRVTALVVRGADGRELRRVDFPAASVVRLGGQPDADHLVYGVRGDGGVRTWASYLLDVRTGAARLLGRDLAPMAFREGYPPPADLFWRGRDLVRLDLATGAERVVFRTGGEPLA